MLDPQVAEEAKEGEANEVAAIAVMCLNSKGEDRPTMRQVETRLKAIGCYSLRGRGGELGTLKTLTYGSN